MAHPIQSTPVLRGKDAKKFLSDVNNPKTISKEENARQKEVFERFKRISDFKW
jgi:hypothetical protein